VRSACIRPGITLLDLGTGAGFPGLPLKIYEPAIALTAVDAVSKKISFVRQLCRGLKFQDVTCIAGRIEALTPSATFDLIVSRAVGDSPYLLRLASPFLAPDGQVLLQRGQAARQELVEQEAEFRTLGFYIADLHEVCLSFCEHPRYLVVFRKTSTSLQPKNKA
jgi:16S rRNA (guanine527-N7)-methyltransferase